MHRRSLAAGLGIALATGVAHADDAPRPARRRDASWREIAAGPFRSSRLFAMPIADVVGAYQLSLSGDGSLLQDPGVLSAAGVAAIGFGDLAQLEYRHTAAISLGRNAAPLPAVGVQLELPLRERRGLPAFAIAFRLGVPRREDIGVPVDETVTDLYAVSRLQLWGRLRPLTLHAGVRFSSAKIEIGGEPGFEEDRRLVLPALGFEVAANARAHLVGEIALAPQFSFDPDTGGPPTIGTGLLGRIGVRWWWLPAVSFDGSIGYQMEVAGAEPADGLDSIVQWDIRLGGEVFVPWGALVCRAAGAFCE